MTDVQPQVQPRKTCLVVAAVVASLALWNLYRGRVPIAEVFGGIALALAITGLLLPGLALLFHRGWMALAMALGFVNSRILLAIIFYALVTPLGWIRKALGNDPLIRRRRLETGYWFRRPVERQSKEQFERAF